MIDKNDPRLTAFVLNELSDEERAEVQSAIDQSTELQAVVAEIAVTVESIETEFAGRPQLVLSEKQKEKLTAAAANSMDAGRVMTKPSASTTTGRRWVWVLAAAAALLLLAVPATQHLFEPASMSTELAKAQDAAQDGKDLAEKLQSLEENSLTFDSASSSQRNEAPAEVSLPDIFQSDREEEMKLAEMSDAPPQSTIIGRDARLSSNQPTSNGQRQLFAQGNLIAGGGNGRPDQSIQSRFSGRASDRLSIGGGGAAGLEGLHRGNAPGQSNERQRRRGEELGGGGFGGGGGRVRTQGLPAQGQAGGQSGQLAEAGAQRASNQSAGNVRSADLALQFPNATDWSLRKALRTKFGVQPSESSADADGAQGEQSGEGELDFKQVTDWFERFESEKQVQQTRTEQRTRIVQTADGARTETYEVEVPFIESRTEYFYKLKDDVAQEVTSDLLKRFDPSGERVIDLARFNGGEIVRPGESATAGAKLGFRLPARFPGP